MDAFSQNLIFVRFLNVKKIQAWLKSDVNNGYFTWRTTYIFDNIMLNSSYYDRKVVEKIKTHTSCSINFFSKNHALYQFTWKNMLQPDRSQMCGKDVICMLHNWGNNTNLVLILTAFPRQQWIHECNSILHYIYIAWLV
jgi:hypothetical protein